MWPDCQLQAFNAEVTASATILLHHAPIAVPLCWSFCLGRLGGLPLRVCYFFLPWPRFAEDGTILDDSSQQLWAFFIHPRASFLLGLGLGFDIKWVGVPRSFGPTLIILITENTHSIIALESKKINTNTNTLVCSSDGWFYHYMMHPKNIITPLSGWCCFTNPIFVSIERP